MTKIDLSASTSLQSGPTTSSDTGLTISSETAANLRILQDSYPGRFTLSVKEASQILNVSEDFLYMRLARGVIIAMKTGRSWKIPLTEIARVLTEGVK